MLFSIANVKSLKDLLKHFSIRELLLYSGRNTSGQLKHFEILKRKILFERVCQDTKKLCQDILSELVLVKLFFAYLEMDTHEMVSAFIFNETRKPVF